MVAPDVVSASVAIIAPFCAPLSAAVVMVGVATVVITGGGGGVVVPPPPHPYNELPAKTTAVSNNPFARIFMVPHSLRNKLHAIRRTNETTFAMPSSMPDRVEWCDVSYGQNPRRNRQFRRYGLRFAGCGVRVMRKRKKERPGVPDTTKQGLAGRSRRTQVIQIDVVQLSHLGDRFTQTCEEESRLRSKSTQPGELNAHSGIAGRCWRKACRSRGLSAFSTACSTRARSSALGAERPMASMAAGASRASRAMIASR